MSGTLLLLIFLIITILLLFSFQTKDGFQGRTDFIDERQKYFGDIGISLAASDSDSALGDTANSILGTFGVKANYPVQSGKSELGRMIEKCEAVKTDDCSAFDDPAFTASCGLCLELGENSKKLATKGGLVVISSDKAVTRKSARPNSLPKYSATIGMCPADRLVTTKAECQKLKRQLQCEKNSSYDLAACSQCYSTTDYSIVDPAISPGVVAGSGKLHLYGKGTLSFTEDGFSTKSGVALSENSPYVINVRGKESVRIKLTVTPPANSDPENPTLPKVVGVLSGPTQSGKFDLDIRRIVLNDEATGRKPRSEGSKTIGGITATMMAPGFGQQKMVLVLIIPFTFVDPSSEESLKCKDAPFITKKTSAEFLASDPCYKNGAGPGKFSLECLQGAWVTNGCSEQGKGYPETSGSAATLMANPDGTLRSLNEISDYIYNMAIITTTGVDDKGKKQTIENQSKASVFCTGVTVSSPCDNAAKESGPLSPECITYLWNNKGSDKLSNGQTNPLGPTYTGLGSSLFGTGTTKRFCQDSGSLSPAKGKDNIKYWQKFGGVKAVMREMSNLYNAANAQLAADDQLAPYFKQCYGDIQLAKAPSCASGLLPASYVPKQNTVLASNLTMTQDYVLTMDITPKGTIGHWASIIHFTTGPDCCAFGNRAPGIWFAPNTIDTFAMHIGHSNDGDWAARPSGMPFAIGKTSKFKLECVGQNITITIDDKVYKYTHDGYRYSGKIETVYGGNPWYPAANCSIDNVCLQLIGDSTLTPANAPLSQYQKMFVSSGCTRVLTEDDIGWWRKGKTLADVQNDMNAYGSLTKGCTGILRQHEFCSPGKCPPPFKCSTDLLPKSYNPTRGDATVKNLTMTQDYKLEFDITPSAINTDNASGGWASIIHFTANNSDWGMLGSRTPAIWFVPGTLNLHVRIGDSTDHNWGFDSQPGCAINKKSHVSLECRGQSVTLKIDSNTFTMTQPTYRYGGPVTVYASDPWYPPAKAYVENLCLVTYGDAVDNRKIITFEDININGGGASVNTNIGNFPNITACAEAVKKRYPSGNYAATWTPGQCWAIGPTDPYDSRFNPIQGYHAAYIRAPSYTIPGIDNVKVVMLAGGRSCLNFSQLVVLDQNGKNISKGRPTAGSGEWEPTSSTSKAVDGVNTPRGHPNEYHSSAAACSANVAYWKVTLDSPSTVSAIIIYNRADCCQDRMASFNMHFFNANGDLIYWKPNMSTARVSLLPTNSTTNRTQELKGGQNWFCYSARYPDLYKAFDAPFGPGNNQGALANHYYTHGKREGRNPSC